MNGPFDAPRSALEDRVGSVAMTADSAKSNGERRFGARSTALEVIAGHDLYGREAIVTGGASGIGVETARALATAGARVVVAARHGAHAQNVAAAPPPETGNEQTEARAVDLAPFAAVRRLVAADL